MPRNAQGIFFPGCVAPGETIRLWGRSEETGGPHFGGFLHVAAGREEKNCLIEISNGGFHLSEEESSLMFEPYFTSKSRGTGLGLVISNKIVQAHGGELDYHIDFVRHVMNLSIKLPLW